jgi:lysozyme
MNPANKWLVGYISSALIASASVWEGTRYYAYLDLGGVPTVCQGHTGNGITFGRKYSAEECSAFLRTDLIKHSSGVLECINKPLKENEFNAFVLFAYNVGVSGACNSRAFREFNAGNTETACRAMAYSPKGDPAWSYVDGKFTQGLHNRRLYEMRMCLGDK